MLFILKENIRKDKSNVLQKVGEKNIRLFKLKKMFEYLPLM